MVHGQVLNFTRNLPDITHDAFCNAVMCDFKTDGLWFAGAAGPFQVLKTQTVYQKPGCKFER